MIDWYRSVLVHCSQNTVTPDRKPYFNCIEWKNLISYIEIMVGYVWIGQRPIVMEHYPHTLQFPFTLTQWILTFTNPANSYANLQAVNLPLISTESQSYHITHRIHYYGILVNKLIFDISERPHTFPSVRTRIDIYQNLPTALVSTKGIFAQPKDWLLAVFMTNQCELCCMSWVCGLSSGKPLRLTQRTPVL